MSLKNWKKIYNDRLTTPEEAAKSVKGGETILISGSEPYSLEDAIAERYEEYKEKVFINCSGLYRKIDAIPFFQPGIEEHFRIYSGFLTPFTRPLVKEGRMDFIPIHFHDAPKQLFLEGIRRPNIVLAQVSPPDEHGFCSFGIAVDYVKTAAEVADMIMVEVNENMPRTLGDSFIHVSEITHIIERSAPIRGVPRPTITKAEEQIAENVASLINDGDTIQLGFGAIPAAIALFLNDKQDLGVHTEFFTDSVMDLVYDGVITGKKKTLHKGKIISTGADGTPELYKFVHNNPFIEMHPVLYVNDPCVIGKNDNMKAINSAIQVDLTGQIAAESIGPEQVTGVGGQVDFMRGASASNGGLGIIAMRSTANKGRISKITSSLYPGTIVTTSRCDIHCIVTEFGIAHLVGRSIRERAEALIKITHPDFQDDLEKEAKKLNLIH
jgi:4-hydroxybutyrate CoA-transferase